MSKDRVSVADQLRDLLSRAKPEDVAEIDATIAEKEKEIAELRTTRKLLAVAAGVEEPVKRGGYKRKKSESDKTATVTGGNNPWTAQKTIDSLADRRKKAVAYLRSNGAKHIDSLSTKLGIPRPGPGGLSQVLQHEWFHTNPEGIVSLTDKGDRAYVD